MKVALAVEGDTTEANFEFPILLAVPNLLGCGCELRPSSELFLMGCYVSYKDNVHRAACLSQITLYVHFLLGKKEKQALKKRRRSSFPLLMKLDNI